MYKISSIFIRLSCDTRHVEEYKKDYMSNIIIDIALVFFPVLLLIHRTRKVKDYIESDAHLY